MQQQQDRFKDIFYLPSFSAAAGYYKKNTPLHDTLNFRSFYEEDGFLEPQYLHKYFLISAGIHYKRMNIREDMGLNNGSFVMGDSGGHQIAMGTMKWDTKLREDIFNWLENNSDVAVNIDIPPREKYEGRFYEALDFSYDNFKWFNEHQSGKTKFLSVIQGTDPEQYPIWYDKIKGFDFNGWCVGGGISSLSRMLFAFATLLAGGEMENKNNLYLHFLGQTKPKDWLIYNIIQKKLDENGMDQVQVMTDSSTPWKMSIFGNYFINIDYKNLSYNLYHWDKKLKYIDEHPMPCPANCPACRGVKIKDIKEYKTSANHIVAYHNFFMYMNFMKEVKRLCLANTDFLYEMIDKDIYKVLASIETMIDNPKDALRIARKHKDLYDRLSVKEKVFIDKDLASEFFE